MRRKNAHPYTADWPAIARRVKEAAGWCCIRCGHPHDPPQGYTLTCHHLDIDPSNNAWWNTLALCQRCHLSVQGRVDLNRPWVFEHRDWFKPYVAGWYAHFYLGQDLTRAEVEARLDELLRLEERAVLPWTAG
jgi:5-methylcytosine-specific restriction endonuclease McrA